MINDEIWRLEGNDDYESDGDYGARWEQVRNGCENRSEMRAMRNLGADRHVGAIVWEAWANCVSVSRRSLWIMRRYVPANWAWTVCESWDPSTTLSVGGSAVNTVSKLDTSTGDATLGLKGGWIFFCKSLSKSMFCEKNGWLLISSAPLTPSRRVGSRSRSLVRMLRAWGLISSPKTRGSLRIFWYITSVFSVRVLESFDFKRSW